MRISFLSLFFLFGLSLSVLLAEQKYFNDLKLGSDFQKGLEELLEGNQSVRLADLKRQLTQKHSKVVLGEIPIPSVSPNKL